MSANTNIDSGKLEFKILETSDDLSSFDCSKDDTMGLNEFIHEEALQYQKEKLGITYLFFHENNVVGFVTLAMSQIEVKETPPRLPFPVTIKYYPALKIGRLAVDNKYREKNVGTNICLWSLYFAEDLSKGIGCRFVVVLTQGKTINFYEKCDFEIVPKYKNKPKVFLFLKIPQS